MHNFKILNICLFEGNINADVFYTRTVHQLLPSLLERTVIVADNDASRKRIDCLEAIKTQGCELLFLPPYSPDLNSIEKKWAQDKMIRKKYRCNPYQLFQGHWI